MSRSLRHGKPDAVGTIVIDGVSLTNPFETLILVNVQVLKLLLIPPTFPLRLAELSGHSGRFWFSVANPFLGFSSKSVRIVMDLGGDREMNEQPKEKTAKESKRAFISYFVFLLLQWTMFSNGQILLVGGRDYINNTGAGSKFVDWSRPSRSVKAIKDANGDIVSAIMELTT
ncbi:unnamed protein product [Microthlaspi erraticum]|uniref:Uncharacterized protein n=1 Tax=Microthlaspi erraticum TaxID=1685480 RepID=A0A6D2J2U0_9BRAS|nr:unnamed protein product [Microthlaspi erraticum]